MERRRFLRLTGAAALAPLWEGSPALGPGHRSNRRWPGYDQALVVDALASPLQFNIPQGSLPLDSAALEAVRASGITAVNVTAHSPGRNDTFGNARARMSGWTREAEANPSHLRMVRTVADLRAAKADGQLGIILGFQDAVPFQDDLSRLDTLHREGLRIVQLTYNVQNRVGSGCLAPGDAGLTALGREAVARLDALGIVVDLSHCGPRTTRDGIRASARPVAITHTGCSALFDHPRNKDDATLREVAERGGFVGIYLMPFLNPAGPPTAAHVVDHLEHALRVCGEDHVGIGSDQGIVPLEVGGDFQERFQEVSARRAAAGIAAPREDTIPYVPELNHPRRMETLADLLAERGHPDRVIRKVLGENALRVFGQVWG